MSKRIPYKITDLDKLAVAYPEIVTEETVVRRVVDKERLYKLVKLHNELGRQIDGVEIGPRGDTDEEWGKRAAAAEKEGFIGPDESEKFMDELLSKSEATAEVPAFLNKGSK